MSSPMGARELLFQIPLLHWPCQQGLVQHQRHQVLKTPKHTHQKPTQGIFLSGNQEIWQVGAVSTAEMNKTSDSKFIKRTHLYFNLKCQTSMHSFALKSIPIIKQTDRRRIPFVFLISHWTKMSIMLSGNFKKSQVFLNHSSHWFLCTC